MLHCIAFELTLYQGFLVMSQPSSFQVYVDEAGDEGFRFPESEEGTGSSRWFIMAAVITRTQTDLETVKLINRVRATIRRDPKQSDPLHFQKMSHEHRLPLVNAIAQADLRAIVVMIHKPSLVDTEMFMKKNVLYHHATRFLLERVSWACDDWFDEDVAGDGTAEVHFSNRGGMKIEELRRYIGHLAERDDCRIDWQRIRPDQCCVLEKSRWASRLQMPSPAVSSARSGLSTVLRSRVMRFP
jgi:hypothetical protein